jgi:hypothetical protein
MTAAKPPALCAYCPACGHYASSLRRDGTHKRHSYTFCTSGGYVTHWCPGSGKPATDATIAQWLQWEAARHRKSLAALRFEKCDDTPARIAAVTARLTAIEAIAAARGTTPKDPTR